MWNTYFVPLDLSQSLSSLLSPYRVCKTWGGIPFIPFNQFPLFNCPSFLCLVSHLSITFSLILQSSLGLRRPPIILFNRYHSSMTILWESLSVIRLRTLGRWTYLRMQEPCIRPSFLLSVGTNIFTETVVVVIVVLLWFLDWDFFHIAYRCLRVCRPVLLFFSLLVWQICKKVFVRYVNIVTWNAAAEYCKLNTFLLHKHTFIFLR